MLLPATSRRVEKAFLYPFSFSGSPPNVCLKSQDGGNLRGPGQVETVQHKLNPLTKPSGRWDRAVVNPYTWATVFVFQQKRGHIFVNAYWHKISIDAKGRGVLTLVLRTSVLKQRKKISLDVILANFTYRQIKWNLVILLSCGGIYLFFLEWFGATCPRRVTAS